MAKINIPKVTRPLDLDDYYDSGEPQVIHVWVNPPRAINNAYEENRTRGVELVARMGDTKADPESDEVKRMAKELVEISEFYNGFWSQIWSQHKDKSTHWSPEDVREFNRQCQEIDPGLYDFATSMSFALMGDYLRTNRKKGKTRSSTRRSRKKAS